MAKKKVETLYKAELKHGEELFKSEGETAFEALQKLNPAKELGALFFKTKGHITLIYGENKVERTNLTLFQLRRLFNKLNTKVAIEILAQQMERGLK